MSIEHHIYPQSAQSPDNSPQKTTKQQQKIQSVTKYTLYQLLLFLNLEQYKFKFWGA